MLLLLNSVFNAPDFQKKPDDFFNYRAFLFYNLWLKQSSFLDNLRGV